jgi:hypothetical protein
MLAFTPLQGEISRLFYESELLRAKYGAHATLTGEIACLLPVADSAEAGLWQLADIRQGMNIICMAQLTRYCVDSQLVSIA